jgi:hypothetical protein
VRFAPAERELSACIRVKSAAAVLVCLFARNASAHVHIRRTNVCTAG